jgi:hypothetical protein
VGLDSSVGLVVATLDLKLVRLLRAAMRPGDGRPGAGLRLIHPAPAVEPRRRTGAEPVIEPRAHVQPAPVFEPRDRLRLDACAPAHCATCSQLAPAEPVETPSRSSSPIEPPWKVLPWEDWHRAPPPRPVRKIKIVMTRPDSYCKGSVIDLFI